MEPVMQNHAAKHTLLDMKKWHELIDAWSKSGENQKTYCQRIGVSLNTFTYARAKLSQAKKLKTAFVPVTLKDTQEEKTSSLSSVIILENPKGYKLHFPAALSLDQLAKLFQLLGWCHA
jgi:hypothetical protein